MSLTSSYYKEAIWDDDAVRLLQERTRLRQEAASAELKAKGMSLLTGYTPPVIDGISARRLSTRASSRPPDQSI